MEELHGEVTGQVVCKDPALFYNHIDADIGGLTKWVKSRGVLLSICSEAKKQRMRSAHIITVVCVAVAGLVDIKFCLAC